MADGGSSRNRRRGTRCNVRPGRIYSGTGNHDWNFARNDHPRLYTDSGNDSAGNREPDPWNCKSDARNRNTGAGNSPGDSPD